MNHKSLLTLAVTGALIMTACAQTPKNPNKPGRIFVDLKTPYNASGTDDVARIKHLMRGVGWEFNPNEATDKTLRELGIHTLRCINIDSLPGKFDENGNYIVSGPNDRMLAHLQTCKNANIKPHFIIGCYIPEALVKTVEKSDDPEASNLGLKRNMTVGPTDLRLYKNYWLAFFEYWLVEQKLGENAEFEIFNEPESGGVASLQIPIPAMGSRELYKGMFALYKAIMIARKEFEAKHPDIKVRLGAPALVWAYTFAFGDFNWASQFIKDCAEQDLKPDYIGVHFYGNIAPINGQTPTYYPSYHDMMITLKSQIDKYLPGTPIQVNEWGPSYHVNNTEAAMFNATAEGSVWTLDFLCDSITLPVTSMSYLVTTDLISEDEKKENVFGWCSLWLNPVLFPGPIPKVMLHTFKFINDLEGERVLSHNVGNIHTFATLGKDKVQLLAWNGNLDIHENGKIVDNSEEQTLDIKFRHGVEIFGGKKVQARARILSPFAGDVVSDYLRTGEVHASAAELPAEFMLNPPKDVEGDLQVEAKIPKTGILMLTLEPAAE